ncbi:MAG: helix-turn-helix transcriptional regulator [Erythrobacter sp.]|uniref:helix-turn-helix domain-containing protein n=1 Tax=Erythrobacter sp. TaxID=1042 RepID=UPI001B25DB9B|nr:helix-turn-helix transcriptional regulator [Erythrobacter sp.]MBO6767302.1 helix-turn-helix transcriptional regulator [Erythrobacter sp.]
MGSPKSRSALRRLGEDLRDARLRRRISIEDLATRAGTSRSTITRLERGDAGVGIGTLCDTLVVFGLIDRLAELLDVRKDDIGLALESERLPRRGRSTGTRSAGTGRSGSGQSQSDTTSGDDTDTNGVAF